MYRRKIKGDPPGETRRRRDPGDDDYTARALRHRFPKRGHAFGLGHCF
jgi:predicted Zn-dependent protease